MVYVDSLFLQRIVHQCIMLICSRMIPFIISNPFFVFFIFAISELYICNTKNVLFYPCEISVAQLEPSLSTPMKLALNIN